MNLGKKIMEIRKENHMSQDDFAEILSVTRQTVSNWENAKNYPDLETLVTISDTFHISLDSLLKNDKIMIQKMDKKMKNGKKFKILIFFLIVLFLLAGVFYLIEKKAQWNKTKQEDLKYEKIITHIKELGFTKDGIGFAYLEEDGMIYRIYIKRPLEENRISVATTPFRDDEAIYADYDGQVIKVTYLNENNITVYCNKEGNLESEAQNKNHIEVYQRYREKTKKIVARTVELFEAIY